MLAIFIRNNTPKLCTDPHAENRDHGRPYVHTFGRFYVYFSGNIIEFKNHKSKELLALCIDRCGGNVSMEEAIDVLWPDHPYDMRVKALYRRTVLCLRKTLCSHGIARMFEANRAECHVNFGEICCDYYEYLAGVETAKNSYQREYMYEYSWAEETNARLLKEVYGEKQESCGKSG